MARYKVGKVKSQAFEHVVRPRNGWGGFDLKELLAYKDLTFLLVKRDFVALYKQTVLGPLWAILQPLLTTVVFTLVFGNMAGLSADGVPTFIFYLSGTVIWTYFSTCLTKTSATFLANSNVMGKVYFPRLVVPIATIISNLIMFGIQFGFLLAFLAYYTFTSGVVQPNLYALMLPLLMLQLALLGMGFGVIISSLTIKYRDLNMLVSFGVSLWMYATPVAYDMYKMSVITNGGSLYGLYMLNPVTPIINMFRYGFLSYGQIDWGYYGISWAITIVVLILGILLFSRVEKTFMDTV